MGTHEEVVEARSRLGIVARRRGMKWSARYSRALTACEASVLTTDEAFEIEKKKFLVVAHEHCPRWNDECDKALDWLMESVAANDDIDDLHGNSDL